MFDVFLFFAFAIALPTIVVLIFFSGDILDLRIVYSKLKYKYPILGDISYINSRYFDKISKIKIAKYILGSLAFFVVNLDYPVMVIFMD